MTQADRDQALLLDTFWSRLRVDVNAAVPARLDPEIGLLAGELERVLGSGEPEWQFVSRLRGRLHPTHSLDGSRSITVSLSTGSQPGQPAFAPRVLESSRPFPVAARTSWIDEWTKLVAAIVVFALVGGLLVALFRGGERNDVGDTDSGAELLPSAESVVEEPGRAFGATSGIVVPLDQSGGSNYKLYVVALDGSIRRLTPEASEITGAETQPAWSRDGSMLVFTGYTRDGVDLFTINADGTGLRNLTNRPGHYLTPSFSPDGSSLVYIDSQNDGRWITVSNADGSDARQLTHGAVMDQEPVWSPDGLSIAFLRFRWGPCKNIPPTPDDPNSSASSACDADPFTDVMRIDIGEPDGRVLHTVAFGDGLQWSPDGQFLALTARADDAQAIVVNANDGSWRPLVEGVSSSLPRWSPDGRSLSAVVTDSGGSEAAIVVMNADGSNVRRITDLDGWHAWSSDSSRIVVVQPRRVMNAEGTGRANLYVIDADGTNRRSLLDDAAIDSNLAWRPEMFPTPESEAVVEATPSSGVLEKTPERTDGTAGGTILTSALDVPAIVDLPESYLLPDRESALAFASIGLTDEQAIRDVRLVTVHDIQMEQVNRGAIGIRSERMPSDTPMWRIEIEGPPTGKFRVPDDGSSERWISTTWVRASDGFPYGRETAFDPVTTIQPQDRATPRPEVEITLSTDPREPLLPDADVVHVVWTTEGGYTYPTGPDTSGTGLRSELWINRVRGVSLLRVSRTGQDRALESLTIREGTTLTRFLAEMFDGATGEPLYTEFRTQARSADDPAITFGVPELDWYRIALARGWATVVGEREFEGQQVIEVQVAAGTPAQHVAYLDPEYLLPVAIIATNSDSSAINGVVQQFRYETVEGLSSAQMPIWDLVTPDERQISRVETDQVLSLEDAAAFGGYATFGLGDEPAAYRLSGIARHTEYDDNQGSRESDTVTFTYRLGNDPLARITVENIGDLRDDLRGDYIARRLEVDEIALPDGPAWISDNRPGWPVQVQLDRDGTLIVIQAPDRDSAIDAAENLERVNP